MIVREQLGFGRNYSCNSNLDKVMGKDISCEEEPGKIMVTLKAAEPCIVCHFHRERRGEGIFTHEGNTHKMNITKNYIEFICPFDGKQRGRCVIPMTNSVLVEELFGEGNAGGKRIYNPTIRYENDGALSNGMEQYLIATNKEIKMNLSTNIPLTQLRKMRKIN